MRPTSAAGRSCHFSPRYSAICCSESTSNNFCSVSRVRPWKSPQKLSCRSRTNTSNRRVLFLIRIGCRLLYRRFCCSLQQNLHPLSFYTLKITSPWEQTKGPSSRCEDGPFCKFRAGSYCPAAMAIFLPSLMVTRATLFTPLSVSTSLPSVVCIMLRTTPPPEGMAQVWNFSVLGSKRTSVFGFTADSLYQMMSFTEVIPYGCDLGPLGDGHP